VITFLAKISKISKLLVQTFCFPIKEITAFEPYLVLLLGVLKETDISVLFCIEIPHHTLLNHCGFFG